MAERLTHHISVTEILGHCCGVIVAAITTHGIRVKAAIPIQLLPVHLLDGPAADLKALGQLPLNHSF